MSTISGISNMREATMPQAKPAASKPVSPEQKLANMFQQIDTAGKGSITKAQFQEAFNKLNPPEAVKAMGADAAFSKLDTKGLGVVTKQDFVKGMESILAQAKNKDVSVKTTSAPAAKAAPAPAQAQAAPMPAPSAPPAPAAHGPVGNTINVTA